MVDDGQVLFLQSWEKTERLNTLIACAHAHVRNAHVSLQMRMCRYVVVTAKYSDHMVGQSLALPLTLWRTLALPSTTLLVFPATKAICTYIDLRRSFKLKKKPIVKS